MLDPGDNSPSLAWFIEVIAADPDAPRWARDCRWVPGTGYCRNRPCRSACLFRRQREAEAQALTEQRRQRRHRRICHRLLTPVMQVLCASSLAALIDVL